MGHCEDIRAKDGRQIGTSQAGRWECSNVHVLAELDSFVKHGNGFLVLLLVEKQFSIVVEDFGTSREVLEELPELVHRFLCRAILVLSDSELDVGEDEGGVEFGGFSIVDNSVIVFSRDEVNLSSVVKPDRAKRKSVPNPKPTSREI